MGKYVDGYTPQVYPNNADYGITLQSMLCDSCGLEVNEIAAEHFKSNYNELYEKELDPVCKKITTILGAKPVKLLTYTSGYTTARQTTSPHNFLLDNGKTLSIRTTKTSERVAPRTVGQAGLPVLNDYFSDIYGEPIEDQEDIQKLIYYHIHEVLPIFIDNLFQSDYTVFVNRNNLNDIQIYRLEDIGKYSFSRDEFTFTRNLGEWTESTTVKYHNVSIAEIQTHKNRTFKFRFYIKNLSAWMTKVEETTETLGMSAESAICKYFGLERPASFATRVIPSMENDLMPAIKEAFKIIPKAVKHTGSESGERGESSKCSYDFVLEGNKTLSLKTNKGKMVCPPEVGQPDAETCMLYFRNFIPSYVDKVTNPVFKQMVYDHIEEIMPIYLSHLLDSDWLLWLYRDGKSYSFKAIESAKVSTFEWKREKFSFTKETIDKWNESNTVKYDGKTIGEFQVHNNRVCFKFRFQMQNLIDLLNI